MLGLDKDELFLDESMAPTPIQTFRFSSDRTSSVCHLLHTQQTCYPKLNGCTNRWLHRQDPGVQIRRFTQSIAGSPEGHELDTCPTSGK